MRLLPFGSCRVGADMTRNTKILLLAGTAAKSLVLAFTLLVFN